MRAFQSQLACTIYFEYCQLEMKFYGRGWRQLIRRSIGRNFYAATVFFFVLISSNFIRAGNQPWTEAKEAKEKKSLENAIK